MVGSSLTTIANSIQSTNPNALHTKKDELSKTKSLYMYKTPVCERHFLTERYVIHQKIGSGAYGQVVEAFDRERKCVVAIKKLLKVFEDLTDAKRILREICILNRLDHPHVVKILDIIVPKQISSFNELYVVLDLADFDFKKLFQEPIYLTELHITVLLYNLLVGIKYVHSAGVFHRDLKPANCLVNQDCSVKICDFGLSRTISSDTYQEFIDSPDTKTNMFHTSRNSKRRLTGHVATRWYRAPELILMQETYTEAIDVWSIGCIYAELLDMMENNMKYQGSRGPLFPGAFCHPLSPDRRNRKVAGCRRDQLNTIFDVLGTPLSGELNDFKIEKCRVYIKSFYYRQGINFYERFPAASVLSVDLLKKMLTFSPNKRITVSEALQHPLFKDIREISKEFVADQKIRLPFDDSVRMPETHIRRIFLEEVKLYHPEIVIPY